MGAQNLFNRITVDPEVLMGKPNLILNARLPRVLSLRRPGADTRWTTSSVPLHWNEAGLPIGMQFVGRFGDEAPLLRLAGELERACPWFDREPAMLKGF